MWLVFTALGYLLLGLLCVSFAQLDLLTRGRALRP